MRERRNIQTRKWLLIPLFLIFISLQAQGQSVRRLEKLFKKQKYEKLVLKAEKFYLKHPDNPQVHYYLIRGMLAKLDTTSITDFEDQYHEAAVRFREFCETFAPDSLSLALLERDMPLSSDRLLIENEERLSSRHSPVTDGTLIVKKAEEALHVPYLYTGMKPERGFDCSGLVCWSYGQFGYQLPRRSGLLAKMGTKVNIDEARPGDIVCFGLIPGDPGSVYHVGMIRSRDADEILMIHSGTSQGVSIVPITSGHWAEEEFFIMRILE